jgi:hypothetical protein
VRTQERFLYLLLPNNLAIRYGIGVGRDGFQWAECIRSRGKPKWPDCTPPPEMIARQPYLPRLVAGGRQPNGCSGSESVGSARTPTRSGLLERGAVSDGEPAAARPVSDELARGPDPHLRCSWRSQSPNFLVKGLLRPRADTGQTPTFLSQARSPGPQFDVGVRPH